MSAPKYRPGCQYRACYSFNTGALGTATTYVYDGTRTWHCCGACAHKLAIKHGLEPDPKEIRRKRKLREMA